MMRGWRLFGVAGTIFAYVAGILLLSIISLNSTQQRRLRGGRYSDFETIKNREGLLGRRPPLQWCTELKYLEHDPNYADAKHPQPIQTFSGHYLKKYKSYLQSKQTQPKQPPVLYDQPLDSSVVNLSNDEVPIIPERINRHSSKQTKRDNVIYKKEPSPQRPLTALASFPGSGNTWLRYLLQQATGILTGSVYKDYGLLKSGFPAENVCNSSVLVVKTHEWGPQAWLQFQKAILLVRDPDKAIIAEFNRQSGGHVGFASPDRYKRSKGRYWQQFVSNKLWAWEQMNLGWAKNFTGDIKIIFYDDLTENVEATLREILQFINYPINEDKVKCAIARREGIYRRKKRVMTFDPYSTLMRRALEDKRDEVYAILGRIRP